MRKDNIMIRFGKEAVNMRFEPNDLLFIDEFAKASGYDRAVAIRACIRIARMVLEDEEKGGINALWERLIKAREEEEV